MFRKTGGKGSLSSPAFEGRRLGHPVRSLGAKVEDVVRADAFDSGATGAVVLAGGLALAAVLLLAPGAARAADECGAASGDPATVNCPNAAYTSGIVYWDQPRGITLTVPGTAATTTITTDANGMQDSGIAIRTNTHASDARNISLTVGGTGPVNIVQGATPHTDHADLLPPLANSRGIFVSQRSGNGATTTVDVESGVTIGSPTNRMNANGLHVEVGVRDMTMGLVQAGSAGAVMVTNEADIYADWHGVAVDSTGVAGTAGTTVINRGAITAGETGIGILNIAPTAGAITVTNEGDIVAGVVSVGSGVGVTTADAAATTVTNSGTITADLNGITVVKSLGSAGPITVTNSGAIESKSTSASANLANNGILAWSNGEDSASNGEDSAGANGGVSVTHSGGAISVPSGGKGIRANVGGDRTGAGNTGAARVSVTGGSITAKGGAIEAINRRAGSVQVDVSPGVALTSPQGHGIQAHVTDAGNTAGQVKITQGGRITARTGVDAAVLRAGAVVTIAAGTTTYETRMAAEQPLIDVTWTGTFSHGTTATVAPNDNDRFTASDAGGAITTHREVEAEKAMRPMPEVGTGFLRYGSPAGIEAQVMSWRDVAAKVAEGDDPGAIADGTAQMNLLSESHADSRRTEILRAFKAALENGEIDVADSVFDAIKTGATSLEGVTDAEILTYLEKDDAATRILLRNVLAQSLSDEEKAVLRAVATDTGLDAALDDEDAGFSDDYKMAVRDLLKRSNAGNIRIAMNGGSINSRGDGIRAYYATPHDRNGAIDVTIAAGTTVTGAMAGIYVANAGMGTVGEESDRGKALGLKEDVTLRQQFITVNGMVTGGTDAAVHLSGGGVLLVGEKGKVHAGSSGRAILVNDPGRSEIVINGEVRGGAGARAAVDVTGESRVEVGLTGSVDPNGATAAIGGYKAPGEDTAKIQVVLRVRESNLPEDEKENGEGPPVSQDAAEEALERVGGADKIAGDGIAGTSGGPQVTFATPGGMTELGPIRDGNVVISHLPTEDSGPDGNGDMPDDDPTKEPGPRMECELAMDKRCGLYGALPSVLLSMNGLPSYAERMSAVRDANGGWARVEAVRGEWRAKKASPDGATPGKLAYDHRRIVGRAGVDFAAGDHGRVGVSMHMLDGKAEMSGVGEVALDGVGAGASATWLAGDLYVDAQAAVTWYGADLESHARPDPLKKDASGRGYALGVEAGQRTAVGEGLTVTRRAGLVWSKVGMDDFTDTVESGTRVSVEDATSTKGRLGVLVEKETGLGETSGRLFGSLDVEQELSGKTRVKVGATSLSENVLKTEVRPTAVRLGVGGMFSLDENVFLSATASYETSGGGTSWYGGGVDLEVRF